MTSSRHRSDSDCRGCSTFALAYSTHSGSLRLRDSFPDIKDVAAKKTNVSNFDQFLQVRILTLSLGLGVGPCTRPST